MTHISIIIVHYNSKAETLACLDSLEKIKVKNISHSIVVVDNGSQELLELPDKYSRSKKIHLLRSESNLGFTGGNNLGMYYAIENFNSGFLALLNNDTVVKPDYLEKLYEAIQEDRWRGIVSSKIYFYPGTEFHADSYQKKDRGNVIWYAGGVVDWKNVTAFHVGVDEVDQGQFDHSAQTEFATGCSMLIRREVLEKTGMLDKRFFLYFEDSDLSMRAKAQGYQIYFCADSIVWHKNASSSGGSGSFVHEYYQNRNRLLFIFKHGDWHSWWYALRLALNHILNGTSNQRLALWHFITRRFGKQPII